MYWFINLTAVICRGDLHCLVFNVNCQPESEGKCTLLHEHNVRGEKGKEERVLESLVSAEFTENVFYAHTHTHTLPRLCVIFEVSQPSTKSGLFISPGASEREL